jgi:transposase
MLASRRPLPPLRQRPQGACVDRADAGAENWACLASLIETCKLNGIDPQAYLTDVLTRLVNLWPAARIDELLPWSWTGADSGGGLAA